MLNPNDMVRIKSFVAIETGTYNPLHHRSYTTSVDGELHNEVLRRMDPNKKYNPTVFSDIASNFIHPSNTLGRAVDLPGGFNSRRSRWMMELEWKTAFGTQETQILTGYSDPIDPTYTGRLLAPETMLHVNNSLMFRIQQDGLGLRMVPFSGGQVLVDEGYRGIWDNSARYLSRPSDVMLYSALSPQETQAVQGGMAGNPSPGTVASAIITNDAKISSRSNANPASYMARLLESNRSSVMEDTEYGQSRDDIVLAAHRKASDRTPRNDKFLSAIRNIQGHSNYMNTFSLGQLSLLDPNINNPQIRKEFTLDDYSRQAQKGPVYMQPHYTGQTQHMNGADIHTRIAVLLANAVPGIMADCALSRVGLMISNLDGGGMFKGGLVLINSFMQGVDLSHLGEMFKQRVETELMLAASMHHSLGIAIMIYSDLLGDTRLEVTINNERVDFAVPTFCDATYSPVIQENLHDIQRMASHFGRLMDDAYHVAVQQYQVQPGFTPPMGSYGMDDGTYGQDPQYAETNSSPSALDSVIDGI